MAGRPSANAAHETRLHLPRLRGETRCRSALSAASTARSLAGGSSYPEAAPALWDGATV